MKRVKQTELGELPEEWEVVKLGEVSNEVYRYPTYYNIKYVNKGIPEVRGKLIKENGMLESDLSKYRFISEDTNSRFPKTILKEGDFVLSVRGTMGKVAIVPNKLEGANITANLIRISPVHSLIYSHFLKQFFLSIYFKKTLNNLSPQTTIKTITAPTLKAIEIPLPPFPEQRKIASILSTVDDAIQKTNEIIIKTQELKKGLMQQLLTKGIGHKKFKQTEIGEIPEEWDVVRLGNVTEKVRQVDPRKNPNKRFRYVDVSGISNEFFKIINFKEYVGKDAPHRARKHIKEHDIIFATVRPYLKRVAIVPTEFNNEICSTAFTIIRCVHGVVDYMFVFHYLLTDRVIGTLTEIQRGSNYPAVSDSDVHNLKLPLPPLPEQQKIASILSTVDEKIEVERNRKQKLQELKKGLMQVLLTGKVRVKVS